MAAMVSLVKFLGVFSVLLGLFSLLHGYGVEIEDEAEISFHSESHQPYRTGYHFQPPKNWMNAPMIYNGIYHLFYQYNPFGPVWGNMTWGHSTSTDLINWIHHNHAILPTDTFDIKGCFSGSATILPDGGLAILYTGVDSENHQVQNLVVPKNLSDPFLREWIKAPQNPLMTPINGINDNSFRDPTTAWLGLDGRWRVIIGSEFNSQGVAIMYTSNDFVHWTESEHPLHSAPGKDGIWECPDFFPVSLSEKPHPSHSSPVTKTCNLIASLLREKDLQAIISTHKKLESNGVCLRFCNYILRKIVEEKEFLESKSQTRAKS